MRRISMQTFTQTMASRTVRLGCVLGLSIALSACATSTNQRTNPGVNQGPQVSPSLAQEEPYQGLKRRVAIARFSDETRRGTSFFVDSNFDRIGKQTSDMLAARLTETGRFIMLERTDLNQVIAEQNYANLEPNRVGADYLIVGSVSEFGHSNVSETGVFTRNRVQQATATVNVRLVDTTNGQIVFSQEATGQSRAEASTTFGVGERAAFDTQLADRAVSAAISQLVSNLMENLLDRPWQAYIVGSQNGSLLMTGGQAQGLNVGDQLVLYRRGESVRNPQTGLDIELPPERLGDVRVTGFIGRGDNELSLIQTSVNVDNYDQLVIRAE
ncbi:CsgG/HfaB family protein [Aliidiomarina maris]|uniref:Curli production assembly/transport component CsgG n=2 Tax=Aliidiomarina maris TaxID=531312 RepID=A0A327X023_9GAMM|nr:CsgG/HfaB family protein [Aliidiomarina maris]MCL5048992.1 CsgG/HfaB family protein [Bacillota bacterium]RAJ99131.1 curli biogenesis system outer membrane secretion channel CsgG [Aliidiomarina maris]